MNKPQEIPIIDCEWVFRIKNLPSGSPSKSMLKVALSFAQKKGVDYSESFSFTVRYEYIRVLLSEVAQYNLEMVQFDVKMLFCMDTCKRTYI